MTIKDVDLINSVGLTATAGATAAAGTPTFRQGSTGDGVKQLQQRLIEEGYGKYLGSSQADGIYGKNTAAAVKQYQKDNGLAVDGIAGKNTLTSLSTNKGNSALAAAASGAVNAGQIAAGGTTTGNGGTTTTTDTKASDTPTASGGETAGETPAGTSGFTSDTINQAYALLQQHNDQRPGDYSPVWQDEADAYLSQYQNRDPFSYDFSSDALYQMYRDMYVQQGQMAMMDAMGQAAALSGGYSNSYAQAAGNQAYNQYLNQLNAIVPELYQMAQDRYNYEGQQLLDMYDLYTNRENQSYAQYQDTMDRWYQENSRLQSDYDNTYAREYQEYMDKTDREYQAERDRVTDEQWQKTYDLQKKASKSSSSTPTHTYKSLEIGSTAYNTIASAIKKASSLDNLQDITEEYIALGYDPQQIYAMAKSKINQLSSGYSSQNSNYLFGAAGELY